jgi:Skp family chaperone for outer membrane proteins
LAERGGTFSFFKKILLIPLIPSKAFLNMKYITRSNFTLRLTLSSGALLLAVILSSCTPAPSVPAPKGGVALIDLDAVAKRLGREAAIIRELQDAGNPMGAQLTEARKELQAEFEKAKSDIGTKPTEADLQKLAELERNFNTQLQQKQQQAQQELNAKRVALVNRFREEVKPVALKIAAAKSLGAVLIKTDMTILANDPDIDITDAVVAELTKASATPTPQ